MERALATPLDAWCGKDETCISSGWIILEEIQLEERNIYGGSRLKNDKARIATDQYSCKLPLAQHLFD
jgi:hypothetical protein